MVATAIAVALFAIAAACFVLVWVTRDRGPWPECGECGTPIRGPRCHIVDADTDPVTGEGWAMVADFHPGCCPVIDPTHEHAA